MTRLHTFKEDCWCNVEMVHEDDSYGSCLRCQERISHTEDETTSVPFPCPTVRLDKAEAALAACRDEFTRQNDCSHSECIDREEAAIQQRDKAEAALAERSIRRLLTRKRLQSQRDTAIQQRDTLAEAIEFWRDNKHGSIPSPAYLLTAALDATKEDTDAE